MKFVVISNESQKKKASETTEHSKISKNGLNHKITEKRGFYRRLVMRDVTRDSVIITRDLAVIRNHTDGKPQGHKTGNIAQKQEEKLTSRGSK